MAKEVRQATLKAHIRTICINKVYIYTTGYVDPYNSIGQKYTQFTSHRKIPVSMYIHIHTMRLCSIKERSDAYFKYHMAKEGRTTCMRFT